MTLIKLTHANHKSEMYIAKDLIAGFYYSPGSHCTHIVSTGGAVFPALEDLNYVSNLITKGDENGKK